MLYLCTTKTNSMCLILKKKVWPVDAEIAKNDIVCYKIIAKKVSQSSGIESYFTPFTKTWVDKRIIHGTLDFTPSPLSRRQLVCSSCLIAEGWIHTYKTLDGALKAVRCYFSHENYILEVYKCAIPKGTRYFEGEDQISAPAFASDKICFIEKVFSEK